MTMDFTNDIPPQERKDLQLSIDTFVVQHAVHNRPIAVVSSGGTAADLEMNSVRCLDNFSTGLRGAISVEEFLKRGYAVIHLMRKGSTAPYARVLNQYLGLKQTNHSLDTECLGRLFAIEGENEDDDIVQSVLQQEERDPWLSEPSQSQEPGNTNARTGRKSSDELSLHRGLAYSTSVQRALKERSAALSEGRLLTVHFRTIEEYLAKLQLCAEGVKDCQSLALFFLAAAVSDFYVPKEERAEHKIQSAGGSGELVLRLHPVPKTIGELRKTWAPDSFVVSFKLETDKAILRHKANKAIEKYGCHMVIGNILQTRHQKVWILAPDDQREKIPSNPEKWTFAEVARSHSSSIDTLESSILDCVVQSHFEFISWHFHSNGSGLKSAERAQKMLAEKKRRVRKEQFKKRAMTLGLEIAGGLLAVGISYAVNTALRRRLNE